MTNLLSPFFLISSVVTLLLGIWIVSLNPKNKIYFSWFLFCLSVGLWSFGLGVLTSIQSERIANVFYFVHYFGAINIPVAFLYFIRAHFLKDTKLRRDLVIGILLAFLQMGLFVTGELCAPLTAKWKFYFYTNPGRFYWLFVGYFFIYVLYSFYLMLQSTIADEPSQRKRKIFFITATGLGYVGGSSAFLLVYDIDFPPYGIFLFLLFPIITTYAIIKYRFMDIEVIIKKTIIFAGFFAMVMVVVSVVSTITREIIGRYFTISTNVSTLLSVLIAILLYQPTRNFLVLVTDRFLFQKKESIKEILRRLSERIITILDLDEVARTILETFEESLRTETGAIVLKNEEGYHTLNAYGTPGAAMSLEYSQDDVMFRYFRENPHLICLDSPEFAEPIPRAMIDRLADLRVVVAIPLFLHRALIGLLMLGKKKSDQEYSQEEIDYLPTVAVQVAIALSNARLYREAVDARKKIEEMQLELIHREKMAFVSALVKGIAHEVFNPLTPVFHAIGLLERSVFVKLVNVLKTQESKMDPEAADEYFRALEDLREVLQGLQLNIQHIYLVIDTLNKLQKEDKETIGPVDLKTFFKSSIALIGMELHGETHQIPIVEQVPRELPPVKGNPTLLAQVFVNLFKNSIYAMGERIEKKITIRAAADLENPRSLRIDFTDTGFGIPADILPRIFDFGFTTKKGKGQGIGLNQCRLIVEKFGGSLSCSSKVGVGTTFTIKLPVWKEKNLENSNR